VTDEGLSAIPETSPQRWDCWKLGDGLVLLVYAVVVLWTLRYHEKWADEAQAWLIARDLDLGTIWFHELRYEGSPGFWHTILWVAQHVFHAGYGALGYIGATFAIAGAAVLLFCAPFPRYVRWPLAFTYVMVYQYAVISRPYTLLPLLAFCLAVFFRDGRHPERITATLVTLSLLTLHGAILAGCLGLAYTVDLLKDWRNLEAAIQRKYWLCAGILIGTFVFLIVILWPTADVGEFASKRSAALEPESIRLLQPGPTRKAEAIISGAYLDYILPSLLFLFFAGVWCTYRQRFLAFGPPVGLLVGLYAFVHGYPHHHGTVFVAAIVAFWIAWPTAIEKQRFSIRDGHIEKGITFLLLCLILVNLFDAVVVINRERLFPYSGAPDAADFLRNIGADRGPMFGFLFGVVSVQAYFDHNLFLNIPTAFFHHGVPIQGEELDLDDLHNKKPNYIIAYSVDPQAMMDTGVPLLREQGYEFIHFSDGYYLYKRAVYQRESFFIFKRVSNAPANSQLDPEPTWGKIINQQMPRPDRVGTR
jgi:hypothetical protein